MNEEKNKFVTIFMKHPGFAVPALESPDLNQSIKKMASMVVSSVRIVITQGCRDSITILLNRRRVTTHVKIPSRNIRINLKSKTWNCFRRMTTTSATNAVFTTSGG